MLFFYIRIQTLKSVNANNFILLNVFFVRFQVFQCFKWFGMTKSKIKYQLCKTRGPTIPHYKWSGIMRGLSIILAFNLCFSFTLTDRKLPWAILSDISQLLIGKLWPNEESWSQILLKHSITVTTGIFSEDGGRGPPEHVRFLYAIQNLVICWILLHKLHT